MNLETLKQLLDIQNRQTLFDNILKRLRDIGTLKYFIFELFKTTEGQIPVISITKHSKPSEIKYVKVFIAAQHNEYNGLFGMLNFFEQIQKQKIRIDEVLYDNQLLLFFPLMNPYGFLNPKKENKSGYYLKNGTNLNRYWRRTFAPEYDKFNDDHNEFSLPEHTITVKEILQKYWNNENVKIYFLDFHETSLLRRFLMDLGDNLQKESITYKFEHPYKEFIILNILQKVQVPNNRDLIFKTCGRNKNHKHIQLSIKLLDFVYEKLLEYISNNYDKLPFFFCYSEKNKEYCQKLAVNVYDKFKNKNVLWETYYPSIDHQHIYHGCVVLMNEASSRPNVFTMELECHKQFFNIFEEIEKSKMVPNYFNNKLRSINTSLELVIESIKEMIKSF